MADTDDGAMDSSDINSLSGFISDDSINIQLRKRKLVCKKPEELSIAETNKEPEQIHPESIGAVCLPTKTTPQVQVELEGNQPTSGSKGSEGCSNFESEHEFPTISEPCSGDTPGPKDRGECRTDFADSEDNEIDDASNGRLLIIV